MTVGRLGTKSSASQRLCDANMAVQSMLGSGLRLAYWLIITRDFPLNFLSCSLFYFSL